MADQISDEMVRLDTLRDILTSGRGPREDSVIQVGVNDMDDAALIKISDEDSLVITSDFVRGSGFYLFTMGYLNYFDVGYYVIIANLSDLASKGARPVGLTTIVRYSDRMTDAEFAQVFQGMRAAADVYSAEIVGGDIGGYSVDVFSATAFGFVKTRQALLRKGARVGDLVCVTGKIGLPITALTYFKEVKSKGFALSVEEENKVLESWKRPKARFTEAFILSGNGLASSCQDISDGLKGTLEQMSAVSGKAFTVYEDKLPIDEITVRMASFLGIPKAQIAMSASVDFELMFTMPAGKEKECSRLFDQSGATFTVIGEVSAGPANVLVTAEGLRETLPGVAWKQQTGDYLKEIVEGGTHS
ncbi:MAG: thiamine-phosphate kinase [Terriglobia bacterium]|jgi:thiamine-monophosphate kinase